MRDTLLYVAVSAGIKLKSDPDKWVNPATKKIKESIIANLEAAKNLCDCEVEIELNEKGDYLSFQPANGDKPPKVEEVDMNNVAPDVDADFMDGDEVPKAKKTPSFISEETKVTPEDSYYLINRHIKVKADTKYGGLNYLSWSSAWDIAKKMDSECNYEVHEFEGRPYCVTLQSVMVKVSVKFSEVTHSIWLPVMDNKYKTMKLSEIGSRDIGDTIMRALVKALALHGIGLEMYSKDGLPED